MKFPEWLLLLFIGCKWCDQIYCSWWWIIAFIVFIAIAEAGVSNE